MLHKKIRVGVLRGGPSSEYEISLQTGNNVLKNLPEKYQGVDILIDKNGIWHADGFVKDPQRAVSTVDVVFNAMHGSYGEDGKVQKILEHLNIPYTGSEVLPSSLAMNKNLAKTIFQKENLKTPHYLLVKNDRSIHESAITIFKKLAMPVIVKPVNSGSSLGISMVNSIFELEDGLYEAFKYSDQAIIEERILGKEATCGVIDNFRGETVYSLLPVEIIKPAEKKFFDYHLKYNDEPRKVCPGNFSRAEMQEIQNISKAAHRALGLRHYSRSDFIISPNRGIYILETNSLPGLTTESLLPMSLEAVGSNLSQFLDHVLGEALTRK